MAGFYEDAGANLGSVTSAMASAANTFAQLSINDRNEDLTRESWGASAEQARIAREFNASEANKARSFEERMSNSAYQRATEDMRKAGVNPMLAIMKGGASTPSGSAASGPAGQVNSPIEMKAPDIASALKNGMSTGLDVARFNTEIDNTKKNTELAKAAAELKATEKMVGTGTAKKVEEEAKQAKANTEAVKAEAAFREDKAKLDKKLIPLDAGLNRVRTGAGALGDVIGGAFKGTAKGIKSFFTKEAKPNPYDLSGGQK